MLKEFINQADNGCHFHFIQVLRWFSFSSRELKKLVEIEYIKLHLTSKTTDLSKKKTNKNTEFFVLNESDKINQPHEQTQKKKREREREKSALKLTQTQTKVDTKRRTKENQATILL